MNFRKATSQDAELIWEIIQQAILRRKLDGSKQWQDGYPNPTSIQNDIEHNYGYVIEEVDEILGYGAVIFEEEPAYTAIEGKWLSDGDYLVIHRVAVSEKAVGKGVAQYFFQQVEDLAVSQGVYSVKVDTNYDNAAMLHILEKRGYAYCGLVYFRGSARKAFEKVLA